MGFFTALKELEKIGKISKLSKGNYKVTADFGDSPSPIHKYIGLWDKLSQNKSNCPISPIGHSGQSGQQELK